MKKKVFNYSELHFSEVTSYKIHTLSCPYTEKDKGMGCFLMQATCVAHKLILKFYMSMYGKISYGQKIPQVLFLLFTINFLRVSTYHMTRIFSILHIIAQD